MHFIGNPLYAYLVTIFSMLLGAGLGSLCSSSLGISLHERWKWPFWGIFVTGLAILVGHSPNFDLLLGQPTWLRVLVSASMIIPFGFFLGIPFPLGILALEGYERMAIPWAGGDQRLVYSHWGTHVYSAFSPLWVYSGFCICDEYLHNRIMAILETSRSGNP